MIDTADPVALRLEAERRTRLLAQGKRTFTAPDPVMIPAIDERALEKQIEAECDRMMLKLGFEVIRFSHPGKTRQTEGISDRLFLRRSRIVERSDGRYLTKPRSVWVELKSATGKQRPGQKLFQELVEACGEAYVCGGLEALVAWLVEQRIAERVGDVLEPIADGGFEP